MSLSAADMSMTIDVVDPAQERQDLVDVARR